MFKHITRAAERIWLPAICLMLAMAGCQKKITDEDRRESRALVWNAIQVAEAGHIDSARVVLERAVALDTTNAEAHYRLAMIHEYLMNQPDAEREYCSALNHDSTFAEVHLNLGQILGKTGRYDSALEHFNAALRHSLDDQVRALTYYCVGVTHGVQGEAEEAVVAYRHATETDPSFARAYLGMGQELLRLDQPERALEALTRAAVLDTELYEAHGQLANAYRMLGRLDEAEAEESMAREMRSKRPTLQR